MTETNLFYEINQAERLSRKVKKTCIGTSNPLYIASFKNPLTRLTVPE